MGGIHQLVQEWLKNDMDIPAPKLAKILVRLMQEAMG
jgi:hypothetical protein